MIALAKVSSDPDAPFANLLPIVDVLVRDGNRLRDGGFILRPGGWLCRFTSQLNIALVQDVFQIPKNVRLSIEYDSILDRLSWSAIEGPGKASKI